MKTIDVWIESSGLSVSKLAKSADLPIERVEAIVDGRWLPRPGERTALAAALGIEVEAISWGHTMSPRNVRYHRFGLSEDF
jgi:lambda repressor-like predicted transcriptional regulator